MIISYFFIQSSKENLQGLPWSSVVKTPRLHCRGVGSILDQGTEILHAHIEAKLFFLIFKFKRNSKTVKTFFSYYLNSLKSKSMWKFYVDF